MEKKSKQWYQVEKDGEKTKFRTEDYEKFETLVKFAMTIDPEMTVKELLDKLEKKHPENTEK